MDTFIKFIFASVPEDVEPLPTDEEKKGSGASTQCIIA
jgi:hypothetical protein